MKKRSYLNGNMRSTRHGVRVFPPRKFGPYDKTEWTRRSKPSIPHFANKGSRTFSRISTIQMIKDCKLAKNQFRPKKLAARMQTKRVDEKYGKYPITTRIKNNLRRMQGSRKMRFVNGVVIPA